MQVFGKHAVKVGRLQRPHLSANVAKLKTRARSTWLKLARGKHPTDPVMDEQPGGFIHDRAESSPGFTESTKQSDVQKGSIGTFMHGKAVTVNLGFYPVIRCKKKKKKVHVHVPKRTSYYFTSHSFFFVCFVFMEQIYSQQSIQFTAKLRRTVP